MSDLGSGWIDSHCHLADPRLLDVGKLIAESKAEGITGFVMAGVDPEDWERQLTLAEAHPSVLPVLGLHPYFVASHTLAECEQALDQLARLVPKTQSLVGEMGLDFRPKIMGESFARQIEIFEAQLELAGFLARPVVLHLVRAFNETQRIFQIHGPPRSGGFVHAFNGSMKEAEAYLNWGLHLSIGGAVVAADNKRLHQAIAAIPLSRLLVESDTPDQPPEAWAHELNSPSSILHVAAAISDIKAVTRDEVLATSRANLLSLIRSEKI